MKLIKAPKGQAEASKGLPTKPLRSRDRFMPEKAERVGSAIGEKVYGPPGEPNTFKTSLDLEANLVAQLRAILKVTSGETPEAFLERWMRDAITSEPSNGFFVGRIRREFRSEAAAKVARILKGDRRLVRREPLAKNLFVHVWTISAVKKIAGDPERNPLGSPWNMIADTILHHAAENFRGKIVANSPKEKGGNEP